MEPIKNTLYPVFFKLSNLNILIVGAGEVCSEKLLFILKSSPNANINIVAPWANENVKSIIKNPKYNIIWIKKKVEQTDLIENDIIISATNDKAVNRLVYQHAKVLKKIINVADTPDLCDFYMGSIVTRGSLKVAISTNGNSPTFAKRFRQLLEQIIPEESNDLINNLKLIRDNLKGNFEQKVKDLNNITKSMVS